MQEAMNMKELEVKGTWYFHLTNLFPFLNYIIYVFTLRQRDSSVAKSTSCSCREHGPGFQQVQQTVITTYNVQGTQCPVGPAGASVSTCMHMAHVHALRHTYTHKINAF